MLFSQRSSQRARNDVSRPSADDSRSGEGGSGSSSTPVSEFRGVSKRECVLGGTGFCGRGTVRLRLLGRVSDSSPPPPSDRGEAGSCCPAGRAVLAVPLVSADPLLGFVTISSGST